jgi:cell division protein ZapD
MFEILEVAGRADLKSDLLQELERQKQLLESLRDNPDISQEALDNILWEIDRTSSRLFQMSGKVGQEMRENEWLMSIKQRTNIPGGVCEFDVPSYHFWLHLSAEQHRHDLEGWLAPFLPIRDGIGIVLRILRESGKSSTQTAVQGVYQQMMAGRIAQMLRIRLMRDYHCVPEISANKYALNIRFTVQEGGQRPKVIESNVDFELTFCNL